MASPPRLGIYLFFPFYIIVYFRAYYLSIFTLIFKMQTSFTAYGVEDEHSMNRFNRKRGAILARSRKRVSWWPRSMKGKKRVRSILDGHFDWDCRVPSPFISGSTNRYRTFAEARRRKRMGKKKVVVHEICITEDGEAWWRRAGTWLDLVNMKVPEKANHESTEDEVLFLHEIPARFIKRTIRI